MQEHTTAEDSVLLIK